MIRLVVLGDPIAHSRSPAIHNAALAAAGIDGTYTARRVDLSRLTDALEEMRTGGLDGANITMPHKAAAALIADRQTEVTTRSGSANTWFRDGADIVATSTDPDGIRFALEAAGVPDAPVVIIGAGGAAAAALLALEHRSPQIMARRVDRAADLVDRLGLAAEVIPWGTSAFGRVVVNATPIGMHGETLPLTVLDGAVGILDMAYGDEPTPGVRLARESGLPAADGLTMLIGQAAASFSLWTGKEADTAVMRAAALKTLKQSLDTAENAE